MGLPEAERRAIKHADLVVRIGRVTEACGTLIKVTGIHSRIGDLCELRDPVTDYHLCAEVVGIRQQESWLAPLGQMDGVSVNMQVRVTPNRARVGVDERMLGRVFDAFGHPLDHLPCPEWQSSVPVYRNSPDPLQRKMITQPLATGIKSIDALTTVGLGQRMGIFAVAGGGKSTLLGMLSRNGDADVNVIVLVGERGREVREFIDDCLGSKGLKKSVMIVATSDRPALERSRAACVGTAIAEYFRDQGKRVLFMMDSVTRYARALRDIGLALGEPPARRGFPPSVFSQLPRLFERAGNNEKGYMTAFYTVLIEEENEGEDPLGEEVRSLLDGHILLSRELASSGHYPAIDVKRSVSRLVSRITRPEHQRAAKKLIALVAKFKEIELLVQVGEYRKGSDPMADEALDKIQSIYQFLRQEVEEPSEFSHCINQIIDLAGSD